MQFILNEDPLPFFSYNKKAQGGQYYQWRYRQKISEQEEMIKRIKKLKGLIEKEEEQEYKNSLTKKTVHHRGSFYEYNLQWKQKIQRKVDQQKINKNKETLRSQNNSMKPYQYQDRKQVPGYKGPIQGWQSHFENYLKNKNMGTMIKSRQATFEPVINDRSRRMTEGITGKVQDRLLRLGQMTKIKNQDEMNKFNEKNIMHRYYSNQSEIFYRLYKNGEQINKKKVERNLQDSSCVFYPKLNKLPQQIEERILKKRKPLYYIKNQLENSEPTSQITEKKFNSQNFSAFLKRNQALLDMKKKMANTFVQQMEQKENMERSQCTFSPVLNKNSKKIQKSVKEGERKYLQEIQRKIHQSVPIQTNPGLENIDISKLTIPQCREAGEDEDSLSIYKMEYEGKQLFKQYKKEQFESQVTNNKTNYSKSSGQQIPNSSRIHIAQNTDDSIEKMKSNREWQSEFSEIEGQIFNMMNRVGK